MDDDNLANIYMNNASLIRIESGADEHIDAMKFALIEDGIVEEKHDASIDAAFSMVFMSGYNVCHSYIMNEVRTLVEEKGNDISISDIKIILEKVIERALPIK